VLIVRAAGPDDLDAVLDLARRIGTGMTTLKADSAALAARLEVARASFSGELSKEQCDYFFLMEDSSNGRAAGVCAIKAAVGLDEPFYNYRCGTLVHASAGARVRSPMELLYLSHDLTGISELCSLFLHPDYRSGTNGKLLSKSRFLFIAQFRALFTDRIFAEMRGFQSEDGSSPFWESLGRHFFNMDFDVADDLSSQGDKSFIAQLMPRHPVYTAFLSAPARDAIGRTHVATAPARRLLEQEGLAYTGYVDIFDGGPVLEARVADLRASRDSTPVALAAGVRTGPGAPLHLLSNGDLRHFRVIAVDAAPRQGRLTLFNHELEALGGNQACQAWCMPLQPPAASQSHVERS
jgi:arginine N-succinyltransferase